MKRKEYVNKCRALIFKDTLEYIKNDKDLYESIIRSRQGSKIFWGYDYPGFKHRPEKSTEITIVNKRTFQSAIDILNERPESRVAILNFANAFHPGGGVRYGAPAQEECLCRESTLYGVIAWKGLADFYTRHKTDLGNDDIIYSPDVMIFKTDEDEPALMNKKDWKTVDVITAAAPGLRRIKISDVQLYSIHITRGYAF